MIVSPCDESRRHRPSELPSKRLMPMTHKLGCPGLPA